MEMEDHSTHTVNFVAILAKPWKGCQWLRPGDPASASTTRNCITSWYSTQLLRRPTAPERRP